MFAPPTELSAAAGAGWWGEVFSFWGLYTRMRVPTQGAVVDGIDVHICEAALTGTAFHTPPRQCNHRRFDLPPTMHAQAHCTTLLWPIRMIGT